MTTYEERLLLVRSWVEDNIVDVQDLVSMLQLSIEDVVNAFPELLVEQMHTIVPDLSPIGEEDEQEEDFEETD